MGASVRPDPVADYLAAKQQTSSDPVTEYLHAKHARPVSKPSDANNQATDAELAAASPSPGLTGHLVNIAQGIPGGELAQTGLRMLTRGQSQDEALADIRGATKKINKPLAVAERFAGSLPLIKLPIKSPVAMGAAVGAADQALDADPEKGLGERALGSVSGAAVGAAAGKLGEMVGTGIRALRIKNPAANLIQRQASRAESAKAMYDNALSMGQSREATGAVRDFLAEPDIAEIVSELQQTRPFQNVHGESPEMLDAVYKTLSDRAALLKKNLDGVTPNRPNVGRFRLQDVKAAQNKLLRVLGQGEQVTTEREVPAITTAQSPAPSLMDAIRAHDARIAEAARRKLGTPLQQNRNPFSNQITDAVPAHSDLRSLLERTSAENVVSPPLSGAPGPKIIKETKAVPAMMPTYEHAVQDYAKRSAGIDAVKRGYDAVRTGVQKTLPTAKNLTRTTPEALEEWGTAISPETAEDVSEGILGGTRMAVKKSLLGEGQRALRKAAPMMRSVNAPSQSLTDLLTSLGLLGARGAIGP
jgi:hypothetical protein